MDRIALKQMAKEQIKGQIGILFALIASASVITAAACSVATDIHSNAIYAVSFLLTPVFELSMINVYLGLTHGTTPVIEDIFSGFRHYFELILMYFVTSLFISLWMLLFIIPGIVKAYSYSMSMYILAENKGMPAMEAINRSKQMMEGKKAELFLLDLSFAGWHLVGIITLGIGYIWIGPYIAVTRANFYNSIKSDYPVQIIE